MYLRSRAWMWLSSYALHYLHSCIILQWETVLTIIVTKSNGQNTRILLFEPLIFLSLLTLNASQDLATSRLSNHIQSLDLGLSFPDVSISQKHRSISRVPEQILYITHDPASIMFTYPQFFFFRGSDKNSESKFHSV